MSQRLLIVGAGGFGREVLQWSRDAGLDTGDWSLAGFLDDNPGALADAGPVDLPVIGGIRDYQPREDEWLICGLGAPRTKWECVSALVARRARFKTVIHPSALLGQHVRVGQGCVLCPGAVLTTNVKVGEFVVLNCYSSVGHDGVVGDWSTASGYAALSGKSRVGVGVFLGSHAVILPGVKVGDWATVGAGSVAWRSVPPHTTVFGVPAHAIWTAQARPGNSTSASIESRNGLPIPEA